jgi:hypothetical protein
VSRVVNIPLSLGLAQRFDPKIAPLGVLAVAKNLRVAQDGRLVSRTGYQALSSISTKGTTQFYDLHEYRQRLIALGDGGGDGYPTDLFEYTGVAGSSAAVWHSTDQSGTDRVMLCPFTAPRQLGAVPQPAGGISEVDTAAGGGYVCTVYRVGSVTYPFVYVQVVRESDDQVIFLRHIGITPTLTSARVCYADDRFFMAGHNSDDELELFAFQPGTDDGFNSIATVDAGPLIAHFEIAPITNPGDGTVVVASVIGGTITVSRFESDGTPDGTPFTWTGLTTPKVDIEADATDDTINVVASHNTNVVLLRTYDFSGSSLDGPTTCTVGVQGQVARLPENNLVAVAVNDAVGGVAIQYWNQDTHVLSTTVVVGEARMATRLVSASSASQELAVVFGGYVETNLLHGNTGSNNADSVVTNALFYVSDTSIHMSTRDLGEGKRGLSRRMGLFRDESTGRLAWNSLNSLVIGAAMLTTTTVALNSTARRSAVEHGGLLHIAGCTPQIYDGRLCSELGFNELPGIKTITPDTSGNLFDESTYSYVYHWEFTLPDGRFYRSAPSAPKTVTMGTGEDENDLVLTRPHTTRQIAGEAVYGADVVGVLSRTVWNDTTAAAGSIHKEAVRFSIPGGFANYGDTISVTDTVADSTVDEAEVLYTDAGPVENNGPEMCTFIAGSSARLIIAGLALDDEFQESMEQELDQPINFARLSSFFGRAPAPLLGALSLDGVRLLFARQRVFAVEGIGPERDGSGALPQPVQLPSPGGLLDARSLFDGPDGVWFQLDPTKLYRLPRGGGAPSWDGVDVQTQLSSYPVITGACRNLQDDAICFACQNTQAGTDARILVRSLRTGIWTEDTPPLQASSGIAALSSWARTVAYISNGIVYSQHATSYGDGAGSTVIVTQWKTHPLYPFGLGGNGRIEEALACCEFLSAGTLALRVSYNDGVSFNAYDSYTISGMTVGQTFFRKWDLQQDDLTSVVLEWTFTPTSAGAGIVIQSASLLVDDGEGLIQLEASEIA